MYICWKIEIWLEFVKKYVLYSQFDNVVRSLWLTTITPHSILQYNSIQSNPIRWSSEIDYDSKKQPFDKRDRN